MKKLLSVLLGVLFLTKLCFAAPASTISVSNSFVPNTTIYSSEVNTNFNDIVTGFNAHTHEDITKLGTIGTGVWQASTIGVAYGGTGATSLTDGGILLGSGTGAITALGVATNGQIPIGDGTTDPVLATLTATANETEITNGAGSITIGLPNDVTIAGTLTTAGLTATANLDIGSYSLTAQTLISDVATGTEPLTVSSTTKVTNLNADTVDGYDTSTTSAASKIPVMDGSGYMPDSTVDTTALKTATGEVSTTTGGGGENLTLPGGTYGFYPQFKASVGSGTTQAVLVGIGSGFDVGTSYVTRLSMNAGSCTSYAQQRYVTASGEDHWMFLLVDKTTKEIIGLYSAPDAPHYGNSGDYNKVPHPFNSYNPDTQEIVLIDQDTIAELKAQVTDEKSLATIVNENYCIDKDKEYQPLHSGKYINKEGKQVKEIIEQIAPYIKVKSLRKMTSGELSARETKRQEKETLRQQELQQKKAKLNTLKQKLNLSEEEFSLLKENVR